MAGSAPRSSWKMGGRMLPISGEDAGDPRRNSFALPIPRSSNIPFRRCSNVGLSFVPQEPLARRDSDAQLPTQEAILVISVDCPVLALSSILAVRLAEPNSSDASAGTSPDACKIREATKNFCNEIRESGLIGLEHHDELTRAHASLLPSMLYRRMGEWNVKIKESEELRQDKNQWEQKLTALRTRYIKELALKDQQIRELRGGGPPSHIQQDSFFPPHQDCGTQTQVTGDVELASQLLDVAGDLRARLDRAEAVQDSILFEDMALQKALHESFAQLHKTKWAVTSCMRYMEEQEDKAKFQADVLLKSAAERETAFWELVEEAKILLATIDGQDPPEPTPSEELTRQVEGALSHQLNNMMQARYSRESDEVFCKIGDAEESVSTALGIVRDCILKADARSGNSGREIGHDEHNPFLVNMTEDFGQTLSVENSFNTRPSKARSSKAALMPEAAGPLPSGITAKALDTREKLRTCLALFVETKASWAQAEDLLKQYELDRQGESTKRHASKEDVAKKDSEKFISRTSFQESIAAMRASQAVRRLLSSEVRNQAVQVDGIGEYQRIGFPNAEHRMDMLDQNPAQQASLRAKDNNSHIFKDKASRSSDRSSKSPVKIQRQPTDDGRLLDSEGAPPNVLCKASQASQTSRNFMVRSLLMSSAVKWVNMPLGAELDFGWGWVPVLKDGCSSDSDNASEDADNLGGSFNDKGKPMAPVAAASRTCTQDSLIELPVAAASRACTQDSLIERRVDESRRGLVTQAHRRPRHVRPVPPTALAHVAPADPVLAARPLSSHGHPMHYISPLAWHRASAISTTRERGGRQRPSTAGVMRSDREVEQDLGQYGARARPASATLNAQSCHRSDLVIDDAAMEPTVATVSSNLPTLYGTAATDFSAEAEAMKIAEVQSSPYAADQLPSPPLDASDAGLRCGSAPRRTTPASCDFLRLTSEVTPPTPTTSAYSIQSEVTWDRVAEKPAEAEPIRPRPTALVHGCMKFQIRPSHDTVANIAAVRPRQPLTARSRQK